MLTLLLVVDIHAAAFLGVGAAFVHGALITAALLVLVGGYAVWGVLRDVTRSARQGAAHSSEFDALSALVSRVTVTADQQEADLQDLRLRVTSTSRALRTLERRLGGESVAAPHPYDGLTGLPNRHLFQDRLVQALGRADRNQQVVALMVIDLDRLGLINQSVGYDAGDAILRASAERLQSCLRKMDAAAHLEASTFAVILEGIPRVPDSEAAIPWPEAAIAKRLLRVLASPHTLNGHEFSATASVGIALYPRDGNDDQTLLTNACLAMRRAKEEGGNTYRYFKATANARTVERLALESQLRHALERDELVLHFQPQVDVREGRLVAVETLIRWPHPELGMVSPGHFIPLAEESDLIEVVDSWVLERLRDQVKSWRSMGLPPLRVAVNVSARQFRRAALVHTIARFLKDTGLDPRNLEIEITEGTLVQNQASSQTILGRLKDLGVQLCIDDFGTGYSSLAYLKNFPVDSLKIDRTFITEVTTDPATAAIVGSMISLGQNLGLAVVAEGVETDDQLMFLRRHGCYLIQGFLFSRALPPDDLVQILRNGQGFLPSTAHEVSSPYQRA